MYKRPLHSLGFTLIELMITVAIIAVLAAIAIPQYQLFVHRTKQAESLTIIGMAKNAEFTHYAVYDCFVEVQADPPGSIVNFGVLKVTWVDGPGPGTNDRCPTAGTPKSFNDLFVKPNHPLVFYQYQCTAQYAVPPGTSDNFTCSAIGDIDGDMQVYELLYGTDYDGDGATLASARGTIGFFPNEPVRVSPGIF